ncbi:hypothetical protein M9H77_21670 [Catharanthus roseus]|uniref:Uncharacterized protein n=1 Tax=Catharanthus roseus TaxID=4058 RepID=A0ACC0APG9_CATRO|nr:hypothetical protein M9H77_21670 [Catharanthus roseus]
MFNRVDAHGSSVPPPLISTRVRMPYGLHTPVPFPYSLMPLHESNPGASSSLAHHSDANYLHDIHQHCIPISSGAQYPPLILDDFLVGATGDFPLYHQGYYDRSEQMSFYAPGSGDVQGYHGDQTIVQVGGSREGLNVGKSRDGQESRLSAQGETAGSSGPSGVIIQRIYDDLGVRLSVTKGGDAHHGIFMSVVSIVGDSARLSTEMRSTCYLLSILSNSLFSDKSGQPITSYELWPIVKNLRRNLGDLTFGRLRVRRFLITDGGILYIQQYVVMGQRSCTIALSDYQMRLDVISAAESRTYPRDVLTVWSDSWIAHAPISSPVEHCRPASTKSYVVRHTFTRAFWYDVASHCVHVDHMGYIAIPPHACHPR